jgi:translation initiation factor IF-2
VLVLIQPMYAVRIKSEPAPARAPPQQREPRGPPREPRGPPREPRGPPRDARGPPRAAPAQQQRRPGGGRDDGGVSASDDGAPSASGGDVDAGGSEAQRRRKMGGKDLKKGELYRKAAEDPDKAKGGGVKVRREKRGGLDLDDDSLATARTTRPKKRGDRRGQAAVPMEPKGPVRVRLGESITVGDLAAKLEVGMAEVVKDLMKRGVLASATQSIDADTAEAIALGFGAEVSRAGRDEDDESVEGSEWGVLEDEDEEASMVRRPPVVTVMGHVDHGKTSLLDALRQTDVASGEAGGITQAIGASQVLAPDGSMVTFIDTPGHAAFSEMRARGANVTDVVILVVAADDGVKEQTISSIAAAKSAGVPIVVAINKMDKPDVNAAKIKTQLLDYNVVLEEFGGDVLSAEVSAVTGQGLDRLIEQVMLQAEVLDLKANPNRMAQGVVVEARQQLGQGAVATALVQRGTLRLGDIVVAGSQWGRVRRLQDPRGVQVDEAGPSSAVELVGLNGLPAAGDTFTVTPDESKARQIAEVRQQLQRDARASRLFASRSTADRDAFLSGPSKELPIKVIDLVVKSDVQGSAEALCSSLEELEVSDDLLRVKTRVLRSGAGAITAEDVMLASVSDALVLGFNAVAAKPTREAAEQSNVEIKEYSIVYDLLDDVRALMSTYIRPPPNKALGALTGTADILQTFKIGAVGRVAGCKVIDGVVRAGSNIRVLRGNKVVYEGKLDALRYMKDEAEQIEAGSECGMAFADFQKMEPADRVEAYNPDSSGKD